VPGDPYVYPGTGVLLIRRQTISDEIDADYAAGRFRRFNSDEAFIAHLDSVADQDAG